MNTDGRMKTEFEINLPYNLKETNDDDVSWELIFKADISGPDYSASFEIPVYKTEESDKNQTKESIIKETEVTAESPVLAKEKILIQQTPERLHIFFPMFRRPGHILFFTLFLLFYLAITIFLIVKKVWFFAIIWGLIDLILIYSIFR